MAACVVGTLALLALGAAQATAAAGSSPAAVRARVLRIAEREIGYTEPGNFCTIFGPCELWCARFVTWVWRQAGVPVPSLGFVGAVWQWSSLHTQVIDGSETPQPGDAVLFGTGPENTTTAPHMGLVEAAYPGYVVTIEGDVLHGVRRFVVPLADPQRAGEPGSIWAYAAPIAPSDSIADVFIDPQVASPFLAPIVRRPTRGDRELRRLVGSITSLRAFQHMPFQGPGYRVTWSGVNRRGKVKVVLSTERPLPVARRQWHAFLRRFHDAGRAYALTLHAQAGAPVEESPPSIEGTPVPGQTLTEQHGQWRNAPTGYLYQWTRCDASGAGCTPIAGATGNAYTLQAVDVGHTIRVTEQASNGGGSGEPVGSAATAVVVPGQTS